MYICITPYRSKVTISTLKMCHKLFAPMTTLKTLAQLKIQVLRKTIVLDTLTLSLYTMSTRWKVSIH